MTEAFVCIVCIDGYYLNGYLMNCTSMSDNVGLFVFRLE